MNWELLTALLCSFGFVKEMRPSEAFLTLYLTGEWKNLTIEQVSNEIYPWWTYSYLIWLVPVFLLTDFLRYKPVLIIDGAAAIGTWALLLWAQGVVAMKFVEVLYGLFTAGEVAYYSYLYVEVPKEHFKKISSFTRAATLVGKFLSFLLAQFLYSFHVMDFYDLHVFSFVSVCIAFVIPLLLPWPKHSEIFHRKQYKYAKDPNENNGNVNNSNFETSKSPNIQECGTKSEGVDDHVKDKSTMNVYDGGNRCRNGFVFMWSELRDVYRNRVVLVWSVWWAIASCGNFQVLNYVQNLWAVISVKDSPGEEQDVYNGAVEAASTLLGSITVLTVGFVPVNWSRRAELFMGLVCAGNAAFLVVMAHTSSIWVAYAMYVLFRTSYVTVVTIATAQIAQSLVKQRYGLTFGCNMFASLVLESILTVIVVDKAGLGAGVVDQFTVYGGYFGVISMLFLIAAVYRCKTPHESVDLDTPDA
ncbi:thiamine transporter 2-like isoform X1 [Ruditapes philippinarum]|uniref:thiamine transporter 2-like isoform X1 n=1 Tax=Ruditapes philippinarum TaxID=129788 RepID=UPI00295B59B2|nr:thiamine transporter 2-like isoform X1 [Ruditapes philippinarum]